MILRALAVITVAGLALSFAGTAIAQLYQRGDYICDDFKEAEELYQQELKNFILESAHAHCLLIRGEDDVQALNILESLAFKHNEVNSAYAIADYTATGGTLDTSKLEPNNYDEALLAYGRVLFPIDRYPRYPYPYFTVTEWDEQKELAAYYNWVLIQYLRFNYGIQGHHRWHLRQSPSYEGDRNIETYPKYSPYTIDSLNQTIEMAERCASLPKKRHFQPGYYQKITAYCRLLKETAETLLPLERERLHLLNIESCKRDLPKCKDYDELTDKISAVIEEGSMGAKEIFKD